jgi:hypothetical protein
MIVLLKECEVFGPSKQSHVGRGPFDDCDDVWLELTDMHATSAFCTLYIISGVALIYLALRLRFA